jgi:transcriptional regulator of acetoin/glycerol metabolism
MSSVHQEEFADNAAARAREKFLARGVGHPPEVRDAILASWRRSREWNVRADCIELPYMRDPDLDSLLTRGALPVLRQVRDNLAGYPVSAILTDAAGVVLSTMAADDDLEGHLSKVMLAPGFSYAEASVGTNGLGTALEGGQPAQVIGHEHYAEQLTDLASAGAPMFHPISGKLVGAVGLACWRRDASPLLMAMVKTTADQVTRALLTESSAEELELLQGYLRACRHGNGIVLALNHDLVMMNDQARHVLEQGDQEVLLGYASEVLAEGRTNAVQVELPTGLTARMHCRPAGSTKPAGSAAGVVQVKLLEPARLAADAPLPARMLLPGLVGSGALWLRSSQQVQESYQAGEWLALEGEPGVGKLALARAVHQRRNPARRFDVFDAPEAGAQDWLRQVRRALLEAEGDLVLRHVDQLGPRQAHSLAAALQEARPGATANRMWVAVTLTEPSAALTEMLRLFPTTVALPPLRHHIEDLPELAQFFLGKLSQQGRLTCSPEAMKLLMRSSWPGNVEQLWQVIRRIVQRRRVGSIRPEDLPPECWTVSRRLLRPLEAMERDAIVQRLLDTDGNKARAAESLGLSRATIYRKMHEYGISTT